MSESWKEVKCQIKLSILYQTLLKQFLSLFGSYELDFLPEGCSGKRLGPVQSPNRWKISPGRFWTIVNLSSCMYSTVLHVVHTYIHVCMYSMYLYFKTGSTGKSKLLWVFPGTGKSTVSLDYLWGFFRDIKYFSSELDAHTSHVI